MRRTIAGLIGLFGTTGMLWAGTGHETVIVEPVAKNRVGNRSFATRAEHIHALQAEAQASQANLMSFLAPLAVENGRQPASVTEIESLWLINRMVVTASPEVIAKLRARTDVVQVREDHEIKMLQPVVDVTPPSDEGLTYGLKKIRAEEAWNMGFTGNGVVVGHLDTGVQANHPDLEGKIIAFKDMHASSSPISFDGQGHGTHTAGTIIGGSAGGGPIGVAPGAKMIVGRIFNEAGVTTGTKLLRAMNWVCDPDGNAETDDGPDLISNSWGGPQESDQPGGDLWEACQRWVDLGILPVFAAGNSGPFGKVGTPGAYPHVLAVGSTNWFNWLSFFSSKGPAIWEGTEITKPDVCAPGSAIYSAKDGGGYVKLDGTSMACPHVAGVAALMLEANPNLTVPQMVDILRGTAKDLGTAGPDNKYGWGLVDCVAVIEKARGLAKFGQID